MPTGIYPRFRLPIWVRLLLGSEVNFENECWEQSKCLDETGYGKIRETDSKSRLVKSHRASYQQFRGPIPDGMCVLHRCDNRRCINPEHLYLGTQLQNVEDRAVRGRNGKTWIKKLTDDQVREVRRLAGTVRTSKLASDFGVSSCTIADILKGRTKKHVL